MGADLLVWEQVAAGFVITVLVFGILWSMEVRQCARLRDSS